MSPCTFGANGVTIIAVAFKSPGILFLFFFQVQRMEVLDTSGKLSENDQKRLANLRVTHRVLLKKKKAQEDAVR